MKEIKFSFYSLVAIIFLNLISFGQERIYFTRTDSLISRRIREFSFSPEQENWVKNLAALNVGFGVRSSDLLKVLKNDSTPLITELLNKDNLKPEEFGRLLELFRENLNKTRILKVDYEKYKSMHAMMEALFKDKNKRPVFRAGRIEINAQDFPSQPGLRNQDLLAILVQIGEVRVKGLSFDNEGGFSFGSPVDESWAKFKQYANKPYAPIYTRNSKFGATPTKIIVLLDDEEKEENLPLIYTADKNKQAKDLVETLGLNAIKAKFTNLERIFEHLQLAFPKDPSAQKEAVVKNMNLKDGSEFWIGNRFVHRFKNAYDSLIQFWIRKERESGDLSTVRIEFLFLKDGKEVREEIKVTYDKRDGEIKIISPRN